MAASVLALTLHQIGVPGLVYEAVAELRPLELDEVGIDLQPNAVRELYDLGWSRQVLDSIGVQAREWALADRNGRMSTPSRAACSLAAAGRNTRRTEGRCRCCSTARCWSAWGRMPCAWDTG